MRYIPPHRIITDYNHSTSCAITYHLAHNPAVQTKLQKELDAALGSEDDPVSNFEQVKNLPYLQAVIDETLRIHSTSGIGLPRLVPEGGLTVCGKTFPEGTVLSVPTYSIHREKSVWGEDAELYRPERWFERDEALMQKTFNPFSYGPRCVFVCHRLREHPSSLTSVSQELRWQKSRVHGIINHHFFDLSSI